MFIILLTKDCKLEYNWNGGRIGRFCQSNRGGESKGTDLCYIRKHHGKQSWIKNKKIAKDAGPDVG